MMCCALIEVGEFVGAFGVLEPRRAALAKTAAASRTVQYFFYRIFPAAADTDLCLHSHIIFRRRGYYADIGKIAEVRRLFAPLFFQ